jgi:hypothetical protein
MKRLYGCWFGEHKVVSLTTVLPMEQPIFQSRANDGLPSLHLWWTRILEDPLQMPRLNSCTFACVRRVLGERDSIKIIGRHFLSVGDRRLFGR